MRSTEANGARALLLAIGVAAVLLVYAAAQSPGASRAGLEPEAGEDVTGGAPAAKADRLAEVEGAIARTDLAGRMQDALGDGFGGVWLEPSTARLHVGVTSAESRRGAEAVAVRAGLSEVVEETPVRSSWARLGAVQERWNRRLTDLFERNLVRTSLSPEGNAVVVELASRVPASTLTELRREASDSEVDVAIAVTPYPALTGESQARCAKFVADNAFCDPTIVGGVSIKNAKGSLCSAGPAVIRSDRSKYFWATDTYILTAGHCFGGGFFEQWTTSSKAGPWTTLGTSIEFKHGDKDVGLISVAKPTWATEGFIPVIPSVAQWSKTAESEPQHVVGEAGPVVNAKACLSGQTTGLSCGKIAKVGVTEKFVDGTTTTGLVEVSGATAAKGDSGGPWMSGEEVSIGMVLGTHVGRTGTTNNPLFQTLASSYGALNTKVQLLTEVNEERHPFSFDAESNPVVLTAKRTGAAKHVLTADAATISCNDVHFTKELTSTPVGQVIFEPVFGECTTPKKNVVVDVNNCDMRLQPSAIEGENYEGRVSVVCPSGKRLEFTIEGSCNVALGNQTEAGTATYTNIGSGSKREIKLDLNLSGLTYEEHNLAPENGCVATTKQKTNGTYTGEELITGETKAATQIGFFVTPIG